MKSNPFFKLFFLFPFLYLLLLDSSSAFAQEDLSHSWFNPHRLNMLIFLFFFFAVIIYFIQRAKKGKSLFIRRIAGLDAIEEAVGRATEMGKPILFIPGIEDVDQIQTVAAMIILGNVAKMVASYDTPLFVPICRPFVVPVAEERVKEGYASAGRPDAYNPDNVRYISDEQFAYAAGVQGIMLRDRPAANLMFGSFFAESLMLAETGFLTGAIQVAGTANIHQLPFFVVACDYTIIGEELFATSAYLSKEPKLLGSLKGSDLAKAFIIGILALGAILETLGITEFTRWFFIE
ncbi:MAG: DUF6754 domain-containing protein [Candidatus Zixiibacteriota bacterium]